MTLHLPTAAYITSESAVRLGLPVCGDLHVNPENSHAAWTCFRVAGHRGRHALIGEYDGVVDKVWGPDVHTEARAKGRAS